MDHTLFMRSILVDWSGMTLHWMDRFGDDSVQLRQSPLAREISEMRVTKNTRARNEIRVRT